MVAIEEEWFDDMNLTDGATFLTALIKHAKSRFNQKIKFPCDTKRRKQEITINNGWNVLIVQRLREKHDGIILFRVKFISRIPEPVELSHKCIKTNFKYQDP